MVRIWKRNIKSRGLDRRFRHTGEMTFKEKRLIRISCNHKTCSKIDILLGTGFKYYGHIFLQSTLIWPPFTAVHNNYRSAHETFCRFFGWFVWFSIVFMVFTIFNGFELFLSPGIRYFPKLTKNHNQNHLFLFTKLHQNKLIQCRTNLSLLI